MQFARTGSVGRTYTLMSERGARKLVTKVGW